MSGFPCSFSRFHSELCGKYNKHQNDNESIKLVDCNRDVDQHLKYLKLYTVSQGDIKTEADLICRRAGLSNTDLSLFVCPFHRAKLGVYFQRGNSCKHPRHSGKGKLFRSISTAQSQHIFQECGIFIPVGSGVCYKCYGSLPKSLAESGLDVSTSTYTAEVSRDQNLLHVHSDYGDMEISVEPDTCIEDHFDATPLETGTSPSCFDKDSSTESDVGILSENSSQISSWSVEEREQDIPLENINTALDLLSNGKFSPMKFKFKSKISTLHPSSRRMLKRKATTAIQTLLNSIAPGQADDVLELVNSNVKNDLPVTSDLTNTIVKLYQNTSDCNMKKQLLSLLAKDHTKKELQKIIPGVTVYSIDQARLHASVHGKGVQVPKQPKQYRQRMDQGKLAHALDFFFNPLFHQVSSYGTKEMTLDSGEKVVIPEVVRTLCHANLVQMYDTFCEETGFTPLSKSSLFQILRICPASKRTSLRGLDNVAVDGASAFETLNEVIKQLKTSFTQQEDEDNLDKIMLDLGAFKLYLKTDFRLHASLSDRCPDHCISFALSDSSNAALHSPCTHDHDMLCDRCELFPKLILNLKRAASENEEIPADKLGELLNDIEQSETSIMSWKQHIIRCSNQDRCRLDLIDGLKTDEVLVIMDWAMKFLPLSFREKQSEWFAQKGMNWHICVCVYKFEDNTIQHRTYAHLFDQVKQDWFAVVSILEHTLKTLKNQLPVIKSAYLRSDNAGCYHCGNTWLSLDGISKRTGIQIRRYDFSEAQDGKSYCDAKIAHLRSKMRQYVASGNDIKSAADMKTAIDAFGGVKGCQTAHVEINGPKASEASTTKSTWKGITKISNLELRENQMFTWKAYSVGSGNIHSEDDLKKLWKSEISSTEIIVHSDFTPPKMVQGSIIIKKQDSLEICDEENTVEAADPSAQDTSTDIFSCLEPGCLRVFQSFSGFENHILLGNHKFVMNKCSTYDTIKNKWKESCTNIAEHSLLSRESPVVFGAPTVEMGWALKKERKNQRFTENVKVYLRGIFQAGEQTGRKANAVDVSRSMRVSRNEHGQKMFKPDEWLQPSQIASFFSRLAAQSRNPTNKHPVDDEDLETTLNFIDTLEAIEALNSVENQC